METILGLYAKYDVRNIVTRLITEYYENSIQYLNDVDIPEDRKKVLRDYAAYLYTRNK